jgi:hypothetical protein
MIPPMLNPPPGLLNPYLVTNLNLIGAYSLAAICLIGAILLAAIHDGSYANDAFNLFQYVVLGVIGSTGVTTVVREFKNGIKQ